MKRATIRAWTVEPMEHGVRERIELLAHAEGVCVVAVMPDVHTVGAMCNGVVVGSRGVVYPDVVGVDIGCGMYTVRVRGGAEMLTDERVLARMWERLTAGVSIHRRDRRADVQARGMPGIEGLSSGGLGRQALRDGLGQLGTVGGGNHFVELQVDEEGHAWVMVHSGSRGMGRHIFEHHAGPRRDVQRDAFGRVVLAVDGDRGLAYLNDVAWACAYAHANRRVIAREAVEAMGGEFGWEVECGSEVDSVHNFVGREMHMGEELLVHRKGAARACAGEAGLIPGSMGTFSVHTEGRGFEGSLRSSSHGSGRLMSRAAAARRISRKELARQMGGAWFDERRLGAMVEEAPGAYRDLRKVLEVQREMVKVVRRVRPVMTLKGR